MATTYLPVEQLTSIDADETTAGTLAFATFDASWGLFAVERNGERIILDLSGPKPLAVWDVKADTLGTVLAVRDWRIEVDPTSAAKVDNQALPFGHAFVSAEGGGIVGRREAGVRSLVAIKKDGTIYSNGSHNPRGAFALWRIVTGSADQPRVLLEHDARATSPDG